MYMNAYLESIYIQMIFQEMIIQGKWRPSNLVDRAVRENYLIDQMQW